MPLEKHYSGDDAWAEFVALARKEPLFAELFDPEEFLETSDLSSCAIEILNVAVAMFGTERVREWLNWKIPALDGRTPYECISCRASKELENRIREYLMRFPV